MRGRMVRPEFWGDSRMARIPKEIRLWYIGMWNLADDAGFLEWDLSSIAAVLFAYDPVEVREREAREAAKVLVKAKRVEVLGCKKHARIPTIERHKISGGKQFYGIKEAHSRCRSVPIRINPERSRSDSLLDSLSDSDSSRERAREEIPPEWKELGERFGSKKVPHA